MKVAGMEVEAAGIEAEAAGMEAEAAGIEAAGTKLSWHHSRMKSWTSYLPFTSVFSCWSRSFC